MRENKTRNQGFEPSILIKALRAVAKVVLGILRIRGRTRWSNEFVQAIDSSITVNIPGFESLTPNASLWFRTGHGRLLWRAKETPSLDLKTNEWISKFKSSDIFYDVGANIGLYTMMAAKFMKSTVFSIEIDLMNARILYENIYMNGCQDQVTVLPIGLDSYSHQEILCLKTMSYGDALHNLREPNVMARVPSDIRVNVPVFSLDELINLLKLPLPTKLKIDVDGADLDVLYGAKNALDTVNSLVIEYMPNSENRSQIHKLLTDRGFIFNCDSVGEQPWGTVDGFFYR